MSELSLSVKKLFKKKNKFVYIQVNYDVEGAMEQVTGFIKEAVEKDFDIITIEQNKRVNLLHGHRVLTISAEKK